MELRQIDNGNVTISTGYVKGIFNIIIDIKEGVEIKDFIYNEDGLDIHIQRIEDRSMRNHTRIQQTIRKDVKTSLEEPEVLIIDKSTQKDYEVFHVEVQPYLFWSKEKAEKKIIEFKYREERIKYFKKINEENKAKKAAKKARMKLKKKFIYGKKRAIKNKAKKKN